MLPSIDKVPKELHGQQIDVTFTVSADGVVTDVAVRPPIANNKYARQFDEAMRGYRFKPARDSTGKPVPGKVTVTVTL